MPVGNQEGLLEEVKTYSDLSTRVGALKKIWSTRDKNIKEWYKTTRLVDDLATANMESFVGNDPRSAYNVILNMLLDRIPHRIPVELLSQEIFKDAEELEHILNRSWMEIEMRHRRKGREGWLKDLVAYIISTGWFTVRSLPSPDRDRFITDILNPMSVFPSWDEDGLSEVALIYKISSSAARRMVVGNGWKEPRQYTALMVLTDYWYRDINGRVHNVVALGDEITKPDTDESGNLPRIPIFIGPAGGLPDNGVITDPETASGEIGQAMIATNLSIYKSWNKWWSFGMQLMRDVAQPRWYEKSASKERILKDSDLFKRGAVFKLGLQDEVGTLDVPAIPVELRGMQLDMEAMAERGGVNWNAQGNITSSISSYAMAQIISSTAMAAKPFHQAIINCLSDIDNFWVECMRSYGMKPFGYSLPASITEEMWITADYEISIPGDLMQRVSIAKMLDPNFRLSHIYLMNRLFPDIKNPYREMSLVQVDDARQDSVTHLVALYEYLMTEAEGLQGKQGDAARLYTDAADAIKAKIASMGGQVSSTGRASPAGPPGIPAQVAPPNQPRLLGENQAETTEGFTQPGGQE